MREPDAGVVISARPRYGTLLRGTMRSSAQRGWDSPCTRTLRSTIRPWEPCLLVVRLDVAWL